MNLDEIRSFVAVADRLAFGPAATALGLSPSALTRRVQRLETTLGSVLLERDTRSVTLSDAGRAFLPRARALLDALDAAIRAVKDTEDTRAGLLALASLRTVATHLLPRIIREFRIRFPAIHLRVTECSAAQVLDDVRDGAAEFGFTFRQGHEHGLIFDPIVDDPFCLIAPLGHPLAARPAIAWHELRPHMLIVAGEKSGNMRLLDAALTGRQWRPEATTEVDRLSLSVGLVEAGLGVAVVPASAVPPGTYGGLAKRPLVEPSVCRTLGLLRRRNERLNGGADEFLRTTRRVARHLRSTAPGNG